MSSVRLSASYENRSSSFYRKTQDFTKQYCHIYGSRLRQLSELFKTIAEEKFGKNCQTITSSSNRLIFLIFVLTCRCSRQISFQEDFWTERRLAGNLHHRRNVLQGSSFKAEHLEGNLRGQSARSTSAAVELQRRDWFLDSGRRTAAHPIGRKDQRVGDGHRSGRSRIRWVSGVGKADDGFKLSIYLATFRERS